MGNLLSRSPASATIWDAAAEGDIASLLWHLANGADPEVCMISPVRSVKKVGPGNTGVAYRCITHHPQTDSSPLSFASTHGHVEAIRILVDAGATVNPKWGENLHVGVTPLWAALSGGHMAAARLLVERFAFTNARSVDGVTPLTFVAARADLATVTALCVAGADASMADATGTTPVVAASLVGSVEVVRYLVTQGGADIHIALWAAALESFPVAIRTLLDCGASCGLDINAADDDGDTALILAAGGAGVANVEIINLLCGAGAARDHRDMNGSTALFVAVESGHVDAVVALVRWGATVDIPDFYGTTPTCEAALCGNAPIVQLMIEQGADLERADDGECTPIFAACHAGHVEGADILRLLIKAGASTTSNLLHDGISLLHYAAFRGHLPIVRELAEIHPSPPAWATFLMGCGSLRELRRCQTRRVSRRPHLARHACYLPKIYVGRGILGLVHSFLHKPRYVSLHLRNDDGETAAQYANRPAAERPHRYSANGNRIIDDNRAVVALLEDLMLDE